MNLGKPTRELIMDLPDFVTESQNTASMQAFVNQQNEKRMRLMYNRFCEYEMINTNEDDYLMF